MLRTSLSRVLALTCLAFSLSFSVAVLEPAVLGHKILQLAGHSRNAALGLITFAGLMMATITQPFIGAWSDRSQTRFGRRIPFLVAGTACVVVCLYAIALAPTFAALALSYVLFQFGSNTAQAPWQAVFREHIPAQQRGVASGIRAVYEVVGALVGRLVAGQVIALVPSIGESAVVVTVSLGVLVAVTVGTIVAVSIRNSERDAHLETATERESVGGDGSDDGVAPGFAWVCVNRFFFWVGFMAVTTFLLFFVMDVVGRTETEAQKLIGQLSAVLGVVLVVSLLPVGRMADRLGRHPLIVVAGLLASVGTVLVVYSTSVVALAVSAGIIGLGIGVYMSASWALVTDFVPARAAARYLGIANTAGASGNAFARLAGGALIDAINHASGSRVAGYRFVYLAAAAAFAMSSLSALKIPRHDARR